MTSEKFGLHCAIKKVDLHSIVKRFQNCPCGRTGGSTVREIAAAPGLVKRTGKILSDAGFSKKILLVADENTIKAAGGIFESLNGFSISEKIYPDLREPFMEDVDEIVRLSRNCGGVLSVGSGTLNDICRLAAYRACREFAIFATAPSMDGFASADAPIIENGFKSSYPAKQPDILIGDTEILARAPARLKSAGFGDMLGKYAAAVDWRVSRLLTGEHFCENACNMSLGAADKIFRAAGKVLADDPAVAGQIFECLILTGIGMAHTGNSRPGSGTEHIVSHFWDIARIATGEQPDFHGLQVGVATLLIARLYSDLAKYERAALAPERTDWDKVYEAYGAMSGDVRRLNNPSVMDEIIPGSVEKHWQEIRGYIKQYLDADKLAAAMRTAGCPTDIGGIGISTGLCAAAIEYHPYMRHRMTLARAMKSINFS